MPTTKIANMMIVGNIMTLLRKFILIIRPFRLFCRYYDFIAQLLSIADKY